MFTRECDIVELGGDYIESAIVGVEDWFRFSEDSVYTFPYCNKYVYDSHTGSSKYYSSLVVRRLLEKGLLSGERVLILNPDFSQGVERQIFIPYWGDIGWELSGNKIMSTYSEYFSDRIKEYVRVEGESQTNLHWMSGVYFREKETYHDFMMEVSRYMEENNIGVFIGCGGYCCASGRNKSSKDNECVNYLIDNLYMRLDFSNDNRKMRFLRFSNTRL